ncbi:unnamed protein product [Fusarium langsethiae]|nr:unnamed protein product [Fusarium langsethiae]
MQSKIGFLALTLANLAFAGPYKPSRPTMVSSVSLATSIQTTDISQGSTDVPNTRTTTDTVSVASSIATTETEDTIDLSTSYTIIENDPVTTSAPISDVPSLILTVPQSSTTTEEEVITTLANALAGGSFASRDPDSPSGLKDFGATGNAEFHSGGCYKVDGSLDDGCAALTAGGSPNVKRGIFGRFASIYQTIKAARRKKYTIQFVYLVNSAGSQDCVISATFGSKQFYSLPATSPGDTRVNWARVLEQVETVNENPTFSISLECSGSGSSSILVDSIFISDKVTPETIGNYHLEFGWYPQLETTSAGDQEPSSCDVIDDFQNNNMCDLVGIFVKADAI